MINDVSTRFAVSRGAILRRRGFTLVELLICIGLILMLLAILLPAARRSIEAGRQVSCLDHLRQIAHATTLYCMDNDGAFPSAAAIDNPGGIKQAQASDWIYWRRTTGTPPYNDVKKSALARYLDATNIESVFRCPSDSCDSRQPNPWGPEAYLYSYSMNAWVGETYTLSFTRYGRWLRLHDVINPSQIILFVDEDVQSIDDGCWLPTNPDPQYKSVHNELSIRHDVNHDTTDAQSKVIYDQSGRGNVAFCDGHADFVPRQYSFELAGTQKNPYRDHYQPTNKPLPPDVP